MSMPRLCWPVLAAVAALGAVPPASAAPFPEGVASGDATSTSVRLWTRATRPGRLILRVSSRRDLHSPVVVRSVAARASRDRTASALVRGLRPGQRYFFRFTRGPARSALGHFKTAPSRRTEATVRFAVTGGIDPKYDPKLRVLAQIARQQNDFNVLLGDTVPSAGATTLKAKRRVYRSVLAKPQVRALRASAGLYATW